MAKLKLLLTIGLCVALLSLPLSAIAENPLPVNSSCDGHPWDDGDGNDETSNPGDDTTNQADTELTSKDIGEELLGSRVLRAFVKFLVTGNWLLKVR